MILSRCASSFKHKVDLQINKQRGTFASRSSKDAREVFGLKFTKLDNVTNFDLGDSKLDKLSSTSQVFLVKSLTKYCSTFPEDQTMKKVFDEFKGNPENMARHIDFYIRSIIMTSYETGVYASNDLAFFNSEGQYKGNHDLTVFKGTKPVLICRYAKEVEGVRGFPLENAFCSNLFELYAEYWKDPVQPIFGCVTDLNNWIFLKYDGERFARTHRIYKFALHNTAILSLAIKILNILETKPFIIN